ncbi:CaiB/BaiF CoA transferase family protein [Chloroflexota bacterium]
MPLDGIRVLDMSTAQQGPVAAQYLGDMGADVIKIEDPINGDFSRGLARTFGISLELPGGRNVIFEAHNRNKRGIAVDLKMDQGKQIIHNIVQKSDIFLQNFRPGVAEKLSVDYSTLLKINPMIIYGSANCYGEKGPDGSRSGNDLAAVARSGLLPQTGEPDSPSIIIDTLGDRVGAILFAYGLVLALLARERLGIGQEVHSSLLGSLIHLQGFNLAPTLLTGKSLPNLGRAKAARPLYNIYKCKDARWIAISHVREPEKYWPLFCRALNISYIINDPRFDSQKTRDDNSEELITILDKVFATKTYDEWREIFRRELGNFLFDKVQTVSELISDPQVIENDFIVDFKHPTLGTIKMEGMAVDLNKTPGSIRRPAPELGEHTEEVLLEFGYTWEDIIEFKDLQVIR